MKKIAFFSLVLAMFALSGCPLATKNSIDSGSYDVPSWLPGKWGSINKDGQTGDIYFVEKDSRKGILKCFEDSLGKPNRNKMRPMILSSVAGKIYMSVYNPADDMTEEGYYLFEFRKVSNTEFILAGLKEHKIDEDATSAEIIKFLETNKTSSSLVDSGEITRYKKL